MNFNKTILLSLTISNFKMITFISADNKQYLHRQYTLFYSNQKTVHHLDQIYALRI